MSVTSGYDPKQTLGLTHLRLVASDFQKLRPPSDALARLSLLHHLSPMTIMAQITSDKVLDSAYEWLRRRRSAGSGSNVRFCRTS